MRLPNFLIVGSQKGGTTAISRMLRTRDDTWLCEPEQHYFDWNYIQSKWPDDYAAKFEKRADLPWLGERTPNYMWIGRASQRIAEKLPDVKLIVSLRDPVRRAISQMRQYVGNPENRDLARFLDAYADVRSRGLYAEQLRLIYKLFPSENVHVLLYERLKSDNSGEMQRLQEFLGMPPVVLEDAEAHRPEHLACLYNGADRLAELYRPHNMELYDMLGDEEILRWTGMPKEREDE